MERRLAAILAADVVGYSRLMEADEEATAHTLSTCRKIIDGRVVSHHGRVFGSAGDSVMAEFASPVEAVRCAVDIQRQLEVHNIELPDDRRMRLRIGVNLGDVMVQGDNLLGDGVNIAARLETIADPGGIAIAWSVFEQVKKQLDLGYQDLGTHEVKNIAEPIRVYRILTGPQDVGKIIGETNQARQSWKRLALAAAVIVFAGVAGTVTWLGPMESTIESAESARVERKASPLPDKTSIAVLPFANKSEIEGQRFFADGITDDIINELTKVSGLIVIARESTFNYRDEIPDFGELERTLNTRYVLQGSVRRSRDRVRINASLIDASTGQHVWGDHYDGELVDVFALQDKITEEIVSSLSLRLSATDQKNMTRAETSDLEAYDDFLRGRDLFFRFSKDSTYRAMEFFEQALVRDPKFARAYAMLAWAYAFQYTNGWSDDSEQTLAQALDLANKAAALNDKLPVAYFVRGLVFRERHEYIEALAEAQTAIEIDPSYANGYILLSTLLYYAGRPKEGLEMIEKAEKINPLYPSNYPFHKGQALFILKRYDEAIEAFEKGLVQNPASERLRVWLAATYAQVGRIEDAKFEVDQILILDPDIKLSRLTQIFPFKDPEDLEHFNIALRKVGFEDRW